MNIMKEGKKQKLLYISCIYLAAIVAAFWILYDSIFFVVDDAFITFRYIDNYLNGYGLVFNANEKVEGYTNFLFLMISAALVSFGVEPLFAARIVSTLSLLAIAYMTVSYCAKTLTNNKVFLGAVGTFILYSSVPLVTWTMGGLETLLLTAFLLAAVIKLLAYLEGSQKKSDILKAGIWIGLACLTRLDAIVIGITAGISIVAFCYKNNQSTQQLIKHTAIYAAIPAIFLFSHFLWRYGYYGEWLPNTFYSRLYGVDIGGRIQSGIDYIKLFILAPPYLLIVSCFLSLLLFKQKQQRFSTLCLLSIIVVYVSYIIWAGGDWMPVFRLIVPLIPILVIIILKGLDTLTLLSKQKNQIITILIICWFSFTQLFYNYIEMRPSLGLSLSAWDEVVKYMHANWEKGSKVAINMAGYIPYRSPQFYFVDMLGINNKEIARSTKNIAPYIAHGKGSGKFILEQKTDYIIVGSGFENNTIDRAVYITEKELKTSPEFHKYYKKKTARLKVSLPTKWLQKENKIRTSYYDFVYYQRIKSQ